MENTQAKTRTKKELVTEIQRLSGDSKIMIHLAAQQLVAQGNVANEIEALETILEWVQS